MLMNNAVQRQGCQFAHGCEIGKKIRDRGNDCTRVCQQSSLMRKCFQKTCFTLYKGDVRTDHISDQSRTYQEHRVVD
jgi:hypothetical protein